MSDQIVSKTHLGLRGDDDAGAVEDGAAVGRCAEDFVVLVGAEDHLTPGGGGDALEIEGVQGRAVTDEDAHQKVSVEPLWPGVDLNHRGGVEHLFCHEHRHRSREYGGQPIEGVASKHSSVSVVGGVATSTIEAAGAADKRAPANLSTKGHWA